MTTEIAAPLAPRLLTPDGEIISLELGAITADDAGTLLPQIIDFSRRVARYRGFLEQVVTDEMVARGQTERRSGDVVYELRPETEWLVDDGEALMVLLDGALRNGEITAEEREKALQEIVTFKANHSTLNVLTKRVPEIETLRRKVEGAAKLKLKKGAS
jgi:hypothetical protein